MAVNTPTVIDMERGGHLVINQANLATCGGATDYAIKLQNFQTNAHIAIFNDLRAEQNSYKILQASG
ncbi:MAG: hypothetical protein EXR39_11770 [Betaproteobacteria bacterium]|nr:hypothetical protein [Betaproteobacteria bacterium]